MPLTQEMCLLGLTLILYIYWVASCNPSDLCACVLFKESVPEFQCIWLTCLAANLAYLPSRVCTESGRTCLYIKSTKALKVPSRMQCLRPKEMLLAVTIVHSLVSILGNLGHVCGSKPFYVSTAFVTFTGSQVVCVAVFPLQLLELVSASCWQHPSRKSWRDARFAFQSLCHQGCYPAPLMCGPWKHRSRTHAI